MDEVDLIINVLREAYDVGSPVAGSDDVKRRAIAEIAVRRYRSRARRLRAAASRDEAIRDLARGLADRFETHPPGPLMRDYEYVAERIAAALDNV